MKLDEDLDDWQPASASVVSQPPPPLPADLDADGAGPLEFAEDDASQSHEEAVETDELPTDHMDLEDALSVGQKQMVFTA